MIARIICVVFLVIVQCRIMKCAAKKLINSRLDFMEYTIQQYQMGLLSVASLESQSDGGGLQDVLNPSQFDAQMNSHDAEKLPNANLSLASSASGLALNAGSSSSSVHVERNGHMGPFNRTPLLAKLKDRMSRADVSENDDLMTSRYEFNKTMGSYIIFGNSHLTDRKNSSIENSTDNGTMIKDELSINLSSNQFGVFASKLTENPSGTIKPAPSNTPSIKSNLPICPSPYNPLKVDYISGSLVEVNSYVFRCNHEPYTKYCNYPTFDEILMNQLQTNEKEVTELWLNAWIILGECTRTNRPSLPPITPNSTAEIPSLKPTSLINKPTSVLAPSTPKPMLSTFKPSNSAGPTTSKLMSPTNKPTFLSAPPTSTHKLPTNKPTDFVASPTSKSMYPTQNPTASNAIQSPKSVSPTNNPTLSPVKQITITASPEPTPIPTVLEIESPSYAPTESPTFAPTSYSPTGYYNPISPPCSRSQNRIRIELLTDGFPSDTSWVFRTKGEGHNRSDALLLRSKKYDKVSQSDVHEICLDHGTYEFIIKDEFSDGLCCQHGDGYYKISARSSSDDEWKIVLAGAEFITKEIHHTFAVQKSGEVELVCDYPKRKITIEIQTDNFGEDTSWQFRDRSGTVVARNERKYGRNEKDSRDLCLEDKSLYEFVVYDTYGDGMCCQFGKGYYKIASYNDDLGDVVATLYGGMFFQPNITHTINTTTPRMSDRDIQWLTQHNLRRKKYHAYYDKEYVPLQWSDGLKAEAKIWSESLLDSCGEGMFHDPQRIYGENAAGNSGSGGWGTLRSPGQILTRFVEYELDDPWPHNGHLTQVLWRASRYVGCAESHKVMEGQKGGGKRQCHTQVCRYAVTGNCNMGRFQKTDDSNNTVVDWLTPTLEDSNFCGPLCPPDGCHA
eukprot:CCRYP_005146-RB/>CCRYP_005146-RB protein AED:0.04 eAED:0.04 QI:324/1/1/1/1/1/6/398/899